MKKILFALCLIFSACLPVTPASEAQMLEVYATPAAQPWLAEVYSCAPQGIVLRVANNPALADLTIRLGEPDRWPAAAYRIGSEDILVLASPRSPLPDLTLEETRVLFASQGAPSVQVWVYAEGEDVQKVFEQVVMAGRAVTSWARLAVGPQHMSEALSNNPNAVGLLPRRWLTSNLRALFVIPNVPVLALVENEPQGALRALLACLQP